MTYIPDRYDIIYINLQPKIGSEIAKRRPCLVLSPEAYNRFGKCLICPITSNSHNLRTEVPLPSNQAQARGFILADQVRSVDWRVRSADKFDELTDTATYDVVVQIIAALLTG